MIHLMLHYRQEILAAGLRAVVNEAGDFSFSEFRTGTDELIEQTRQSRPDVLILEMTGQITLELLKELADAAPETGIVLWLDDSSSEFLSQAMGIGVRGILKKEQSSVVHLSCFRSVAAGETWIDRELAGRLLSGQRVHLTNRERELIGLLAKGLKNKAIAAALGITEGTVKVYLSRLFPKVGANDRFELALIGLRNVEASQSNAFTRVSAKPSGCAVPLMIPAFLRTERAAARIN